MTRRLVTRRLAPWIAVAALGLTGCPGSIEDPEMFVGPPGPPVCAIGVDNVESRIFHDRCATSGCHDSTSRAGALDLGSPGSAARMVGARARGCPDKVLVVAGNPHAGFLLEKLGPSPQCGERMPLGQNPLTRAELDCVRAWIASLRDDRPPMDGGLPDGAPPDVPMDAPVRDVPGPDAPGRDGGMDAADSATVDASEDTHAPDVSEDASADDAATEDAG